MDMGKEDETTHRPVTARRPPPDALPSLVVVQGDRRGHVLRMDAAEITLGRDPAATLHLPDSGVSRRHVKIMRASDGIYNLIDLDSTNGVLVNGNPLEVTVLRDGDRIQVGPDVLLLFTYETDGPLVEACSRTRAGPETTPLSERQLQVARLVCEGLTNSAIAQRLAISRRTVTSHLDHIYTLLDIGSRAELARYLAKRGLV